MKFHHGLVALETDISIPYNSQVCCQKVLAVVLPKTPRLGQPPTCVPSATDSPNDRNVRGH